MQKFSFLSSFRELNKGQGNLTNIHEFEADMSFHIPGNLEVLNNQMAELHILSNLFNVVKSYFRAFFGGPLIANNFKGHLQITNSWEASDLC